MECDKLVTDYLFTGGKLHVSGILHHKKPAMHSYFSPVRGLSFYDYKALLIKLYF